MKPVTRLVLKVSWMAVLLIVLSLFGREAVDFVYTGF
jgi:hypothetical protein